MLYTLATDNLQRDGTWWVASLWGQGEDTGLAYGDKEREVHWWPRSPAKRALPLGERVTAALSHRGTPCSLTATAAVDAHLKLSNQGFANTRGQTTLPFVFQCLTSAHVCSGSESVTWSHWRASTWGHAWCLWLSFCFRPMFHEASVCFFCSSMYSQRDFNSLVGFCVVGEHLISEEFLLVKQLSLSKEGL